MEGNRIRVTSVIGTGENSIVRRRRPAQTRIAFNLLLIPPPWATRFPGRRTRQGFVVFGRKIKNRATNLLKISGTTAQSSLCLGRVEANDNHCENRAQKRQTCQHICPSQCTALLPPRRRLIEFQPAGPHDSIPSFRPHHSVSLAVVSSVRFADVTATKERSNHPCAPLGVIPAIVRRLTTAACSSPCSKKALRFSRCGKLPEQKATMLGLTSPRRWPCSRLSNGGPRKETITLPLGVFFIS